MELTLEQAYNNLVIAVDRAPGVKVDHIGREQSLKVISEALFPKKLIETNDAKIQDE